MSSFKSVVISLLVGALLTTSYLAADNLKERVNLYKVVEEVVYMLMRCEMARTDAQDI